MKKDILIQDMSPQDIQKKIEEYLPVRVEEKDKYGEVFTPIDLIEEMLDKLPKEVWKNPDLIWLDPANGIGNFPMIAYTHLMKGLEEWEHDKDKRSNHIIKNMLYMIELNPKNVGVSRKIFGKDANIYCGSFVGTPHSPNFGVDKFDIIMGNPPYNNWKSKNNPIYQHFCFKSLEYLNTNGYLLLIHPPGWKRFYSVNNKTITGEIYYKYKNLYLTYIKLNLKIPNFPPVDYYLLQNTPNDKILKKETFVDNFFNENYYKSSVILKNTYNFLPNLITKESMSILNKLINKGEIKLSIKNPRGVRKHAETRIFISSTKTDIHIYPHYDYHKNNIPIFIYVSKELKIKDYDKPKIIMSFNHSPYVLNAWFDEKGEYGVSDLGMYQIFDKRTSKLNINSLIKFLNSHIIKFILKITQYAPPPNNKNEFKILNMISIPVGLKDNPSDEDIYDYYGITQKERELIESKAKSLKSRSILLATET